MDHISTMLQQLEKLNQTQASSVPVIEVSTWAWLPILAAIANSTPVLIVDLDTGRIIGTTAPLAMLFGYLDGELDGQSLAVLCPPEYLDKFIELAQRYAAYPAQQAMGETKGIVGLTRQGVQKAVEIGLSARMISGRRTCVVTVIERTRQGHDE